jgi:hypothetical protein
MPERKTPAGKKLFIKGGAPGPGRPKLPPGAAKNRKRTKEIAARQKQKISAPAEPKPKLSTPPPISTPPAPPEVLDVQPDTALFGASAKTPPKTDDPPPSATPPPKPEEKKPEPETPPASEPINNRPIAELAFHYWTSIFAMLFGNFWFPRKVGSNVQAGEIPFDEREPVLVALTNYFNYVGMIALTPLQNLWLAVGGYSLPRLQLTFHVMREKWFKRKPKTTPTAPGPESQRAPKSETVDIKTETVKTPPENAPAAAEPKPTQTATDEAAEIFR